MTEFTEVGLEGLKLTPHPVLKMPTEAEAAAFVRLKGADAFANWCNERENAITLMASDPYRAGHVPPIWNLVDDLLVDGKRVVLDMSGLYAGKYAYDYNYEWLPDGGAEIERRVAEFPKEIITTGARELLIMGDNRSGKTECAARYFVDTLLKRPDRFAWALHTSAKASVDVQQKRIYGYLPHELRAAKEKRMAGGHKITKLGFSEADGFSNSVMVLPNRSKGRFLYYGMKLEEVEGGELDLAWADELAPQKWVSAIRTRLTDRNGAFVLTFTPIKGYTDTVRDIAEGAETLASVPMRFFPKEDKPKLQRTRRGHVVYFHALHDNYFTNRGPWMREFGSKSRKEMRRRGEGIAEQAVGVYFPIFNQTVHVVPPDQIPAKGTNYQFCDPGDGKPWCNVWLRVDANNRKWIYREWPTPRCYIPGYGYIGEWALGEPDTDESKERSDGYPGPGQEPLNWGIARYKEEFDRLESGASLDGLIDVPGAHGSENKENIFERYMDSRARSRSLAAQGQHGTTLEELCAEEGMDFLAASGKQIHEGLSMVENWLHYDARRPVEPTTNEPQLYISSDCLNLIWALEHWTGRDGQRGACKDWIDLLRYAAQSNPDFIDDLKLVTTRRGAGGY